MCYSSAHLLPSPVCRPHPLLRVKGGAKRLQVCNQCFADTCIFHASLSKSLMIPITTIHRHEGAPVRLCPPGSVTGICPCRVKECRAWLVTAPRGQNTLQICISFTQNAPFCTMFTLKCGEMSCSPICIKMEISKLRRKMWIFVELLSFFSFPLQLCFF